MHNKGWAYDLIVFQTIFRITFYTESDYTNVICQYDVDFDDEKRVKVKDRSDYKLAILDAFMKIVRRVGVDKITMPDVAAEVGISLGVVYQNIQNKEALINLYASTMINHIVNQCQRLMLQDKPVEQLLQEFMTHYFTMIRKINDSDRGFHQLLMGYFRWDYFQENQKHLTKLHESMAGFIESIIIRGIKEGVFEAADPKTTSEVFFKIFNLSMMAIILDEKNVQEIDPAIHQTYQYLIKTIQKH